jgi:4-hydroxy-tetrahydrodipicolinate synthase
MRQSWQRIQRGRHDPSRHGRLLRRSHAVLADLSPSLAACTPHCRWLISEGCEGVARLGTTGEANSVSSAEHKAVLAAALAGGLRGDQLMPGTGVANIPETVDLTHHALALGVTRVIMLPPFNCKGVSDEGLYAAYARTIETVDDARLQAVLYHIPQMSGIAISHSLIERLRAGFPQTVVGIKDSAERPDNMAAMIARFPRFSVLAGRTRCCCP